MIFLVLLSLFIIIPNVRVVGAQPPPGVNVNIIAASDSPTWWINNISDVEAGIQQAVNDANQNTKVKLAGQPNVTYNVITNTQDLETALSTPRQVFIDANGQIAPMPNDYFGPFINITQPSDNQTILTIDQPYHLTISAYVEPPSGYHLLSFSPLQGEPSCYVAILIYCNGTLYNWHLDTDDGYGAGTRIWSINLVAYGTYEILVEAETESSIAPLTSASVTIYYYPPPPPPPPPPDGGSCPFVDVWNGSQYALDNNVLEASEYAPGGDVTDYYLLQQALAQGQGGEYSLLLSEFEREHDFFDQVQLLAIDHSRNGNVGVSPSGEILTYTHPHLPVSAISNEHKNVKDLISGRDGRYYQGYNGSYITLNFGDELNVTQGAKLVIRSDMIIIKCPVYIQVINAAGEWQTVAAIYVRKNWSTDIIDMSKYLPDGRGNLKVRLLFTSNDKINFVGLDTGPQLPFNVTQSKLVSAAKDLMQVSGRTINGQGATYSDLLSSDNVEIELTPGHSIQVNFTFPTLRPAGKVRSFVFVITGHYTEAGSPVACNADWQDWFYYLKTVMQNGSIWANIAGWPFYLFGNSWYTSKVGSVQYDGDWPGAAGLQQFLGANIWCNYSGGPLAKRDVNFDINSPREFGRGAFSPTNGAYTSRGGLALPNYIQANRPIVNLTGLYWDLVGYTDANSTSVPTPHVTAAIVMNGSTSRPGIFVQSGLSSEADDWEKGYIATAMAIEEAKAYIMTPVFLTQIVYNTHAAVFSATMLPGGWGSGQGLFNDSYVAYRYVDLVLTIANHYENYTDTRDIPFTLSLGVADFQLDTSDNNDTWADIVLAYSGWEKKPVVSIWEADFGWWTVGLAADAISDYLDVPYLGLAIGLIPLLSENATGRDSTQSSGCLLNGVWANGTSIDPSGNSDPNGTNWGTVTMLFTVYFIWHGAPATHTFNARMEAYVQQEMLYNINSRVIGIGFTTPLSFSILS